MERFAEKFQKKPRETMPMLNIGYVEGETR
jgi:hypothetical protein